MKSLLANVSNLAHLFRLMLISMLMAKCHGGYRPVVIVHGILDKASSMSGLKAQIQAAHPGTQVFLLPLFEDIKSTWPMWTQVNSFSAVIRNISNNYNHTGINIIGYSQGGLISRGVIQSTEGLNVDTFISLASPQLGQYGDTNYLYLFPTYLKESLYKILYSQFGQTFSVGGYWKDPHHADLYRETSQYLAVINNETNLLNPNMPMYKRNFLKLRKLVLIGGPDDGVITPWQSSHFGFFDNKDSIVPIQQQNVYTHDLFGLRTLDKRGDLLLLTMSNVTHTKWHVDPRVFQQLIQPYLT